MKREEQIAKSYLQTISNDVIYEPDGNNPPDFRLNKLIAVEVRRLNKNIFKGSKSRGIELERFKLLPALKKVFKEFDSPIPADNYWIRLTYSRPLGNISQIESVARTELQKFLMNKQRTPLEIKLSRHVSITIFKANKKSTQVFKIGIESDHESGGFVADMYIGSTEK